MLYHIPIPKAGPDYHIDVESDDLPEQMLQLIFQYGLEPLLNARMTGKAFTGMTKMDADELATARAKAAEVAQENLERLMAGELPTKRKSAAKGESREVMAEAVRQAKEMVKDKIRLSKRSVSMVPAKDIREIATEMVKADPKWIAKAKAAIAERAEITIPEGLMDLIGAVEESPVLKARAEKAKAARLAKSPPKTPRAPAGIVPAARRGARPTQHPTAH